jgi:hypothetical protein
MMEQNIHSKFSITKLLRKISEIIPLWECGRCYYTLCTKITLLLLQKTSRPEFHGHLPSNRQNSSRR